MISTTIGRTDAMTSMGGDEDAGRLGKEEQKYRFIEMRAKGHSYGWIAQELGVAKGTLAAWNAELEAQAAKVRAMELEALQEESFLLEEERIRLIGEQFQAEPPTHGFSVRCPEDVTPCKKEVCEKSKQPFTPQWTPESQESTRIDSSGLIRITETSWAVSSRLEIGMQKGATLGVEIGA